MSAVNDPSSAAGPTPPPPPGSDAIQAAAPPAAATGIQATPAAEAPPIPLPARPRPEPITPEELGRSMRRLDRVLVALVLVLVCLVALIPVRNSDFWLYLATARDWLHGKISLSEDPFSYTGTGTWVNHSWLYGVLVYGLYQALGGSAVLVVKAALLVALAALMMSIRRPGQSLWIPAVCTALAVLAMSPRFLLQPAVLSFVLLGVTVFLLMRRELREEPDDGKKRRHAAPVPWLGDPSDRALWLLPPLFALWVNLDAWFFVGPLAVALCLAGELVQAFFGAGKPGAPRPGTWRPLAAVLAAGVVACLLNPFGYRALTLPAELGSGGVIARLQDDDLFRRMLCSPLQREYFRPGVGLHTAGLAYFPLAALTLASFVLNTGHWRWGRFLLWGGFFALSVWYARAIPFFAVVAAPVAALNFQEYAARRLGTTPIVVGGWRRWSLLGRGLSVLAVLALAVLAWPGWLFGFPAESRRVGLSVEPPASLVKLAEQLDEWHRDGTLGDDDRGLNLTPDVPNFLAWLCREHRERGFFDYRLGNYSPEVAGEYVALRQAFIPPPRQQRAAGHTLLEEADVWHPILHKHRVSYVILYDVDGGWRFQETRRRCTNAGTHLAAVYQDGHSAVYEVRDPPLKPVENAYLTWLRRRGLRLPPLPPKDAGGRFKGREYDPWAAAFGPKAEPLPEGKPRPPQPLAWWVRFAVGPGPRSPEAADAATHLASFEETAFRWHYDRIMLPRAALSFAGLSGLAGGRTGDALADALNVGVRARWVFQWEPPPVEFGPGGVSFSGRPAPVLLAVRAARRAVLRNPDDADAYYQLGRAYATLAADTEERQLGWRLPLLAGLRDAQMTAALRGAVLLDPDLGLAHQMLSALYGRAGFADLQLKHLGEYLRWLRRISPGGDDQFDEAVQALNKDYKELEKQVKDNLNKYEVQSERKRVLEKANNALRLGLADKALQVLLESNPLEFEEEGTRLELDLLLRTGDLERLRVQIASPDEGLREQVASGLDKALGPGTYDRYRFLLAAAEGDYQEADAFLEQAQQKTLTNPGLLQHYRRDLQAGGLPLDLVGKDVGVSKDLSSRQLMAAGVAKLIADYAPQHGPAAWLAVRRLQREPRLVPLLGMAVPLQAAADYEALRGVLRLEAGDVPGAEGHFRQALFADKDKKGDADIALDFPGLPVAYRYLMMIERKE
jgi:hypothetical protein